MRFSTVIELGGKTATGFEVPPEVVDALGAGKRPPVTVTIGSHAYRSTVAVRGGRYLVPLSAENRAAAGVAAGDPVEVEIDLDGAPREVEIPPDVAERLASEPGTGDRFAALSYSRRREEIRAVDEAKTAETRARRIEALIATLR